MSLSKQERRTSSRSGKLDHNSLHEENRRFQNPHSLGTSSGSRISITGLANFELWKLLDLSFQTVEFALQ